jgi:hypothetical protein
MNFKKYLSKLLVILLMGLFIGAACYAQNGEIIGIPTTLEKGITVSVAELQRLSDEADKHPKQRELRKELESRRRPRNNPAGLPVSSWPPSLQPQAIDNTASRVTATQTVHSNFLGVNLAGDIGVFLAPPDSNGDVGPTQICVAANGRLKVYNNNTVCATAQTTTTGASSASLASPILNVDLDTYFSPVAGANGVSDPHVRYDRLSQRWFIVAIDLRAAPNRCVIAVSSGPTIVNSASFTFFFFVFDALAPVPAAFIGGFYDYPSLGVDANALYLGGRMFNAAGTAYVGASIFVVRKSSILGAGPMVVTGFNGIGTSATGIYTPQGVHNDDPAATAGYVIGVDQAVFSQLDIHRISTPGGTPTASAMLALTVPTTSTPLQPVAGGNAVTLDANDDRLFAAMISKNTSTGVSSLWTSHAIAVTTAGTGANTGAGRRNGARWYQIGNLSATPALTQSGVLFDNAAATPRFYWFPSIATSGQGHTVLGSSTCATNQFVDVAVAGRYRTDAAGTIQAAFLPTASTTVYAPASDPGPDRRWGDYSQTVVDSKDNMTMWTFQEYTANTSNWGVRAVQLKAPPPAAPTALGSILCGTGPVVGTRTTPVTLNGTSVNNSEFYDPGTGYTNRLAVTTTGTGASISSVVFVSPTQITFNILWPTTLSGTTQTLTITNPDCQSVTTTYTLPTGCLLVPLNLISFTGKGVDKRVQLDWITENEANSDYIVVEKSTDKSTFNEITRLNSIGLSGGNYQHYDNNPSEINYYRLKQVDVSGAFKYSNVVTVKFNEKLGFSVYPNPASTSLTLEYAPIFKNGTINIIDAAGKRVLSKKVIELNKTILNVSTLQSGVYVVEITNEKGEMMQQKIVIEKK